MVKALKMQNDEKFSSSFRVDVRNLVSQTTHINTLMPRYCRR